MALLHSFICSSKNLHMCSNQESYEEENNETKSVMERDRLSGMYSYAASSDEWMLEGRSRVAGGAGARCPT